MNLNELKITNADGPDQELSNLSTKSKSGETEVFFRDLEAELIKQVLNADVVLGCVAWLTNEPVLDALASRSAVSIIVQKEDFLRPEQRSNSSWKSKLQARYARLDNGFSLYADGLEGTVLHCMSYAGSPEFEPIRCVGNHNSEKSPAFPRMHNKFLVFCNLESNSGEEHAHAPNFKPYSVWTGSFNITYNATNSFENAILSNDPKIVNAYFQEYCQIAALSETLDWENDWVEPEFRIGS